MIIKKNILFAGLFFLTGNVQHHAVASARPAIPDIAGKTPQIIHDPAQLPGPVAPDARKNS